MKNYCGWLDETITVGGSTGPIWQVNALNERVLIMFYSFFLYFQEYIF